MISIGERFFCKRVVAFADTDMSGRVHFTSILRYVEDAEHAFFLNQGEVVISKEHGWPRVHVDCDYRAPLGFGDDLEVRLVVTKVGRTSLGYAFLVCKGGQVCAEGNMVVVRVEEA